MRPLAVISTLALLSTAAAGLAEPTLIPMAPIKPRAVLDKAPLARPRPQIELTPSERAKLIRKFTGNPAAQAVGETVRYAPSLKPKAGSASFLNVADYSYGVLGMPMLGNGTVMITPDGGTKAGKLFVECQVYSVPKMRWFLMDKTNTPVGATVPVNEGKVIFAVDMSQSSNSVLYVDSPAGEGFGFYQCDITKMG